MWRIPVKSKYGNIKTTIDNVTFHSIKESRRYMQLKLLQKVGSISDLQLQPKFVLQEAFYDNAGTKHQPITYSADFQYIDTRTQETVIEDVKSSKTFNTDVYKIKKKLFLKKYPALSFQEIY